jgi:hypothetical protein
MGAPDTAGNEQAVEPGGAGESTTLSTEDLRVLFDTAVGSLDFASGFLDNDEVLALRRVAVVLGVDPLEATPHNFSLDGVVTRPSAGWKRRCRKCGCHE